MKSQPTHMTVLDWGLFIATVGAKIDLYASSMMAAPEKEALTL